MKRIFAFISALFVCCSPCFAWTSESFLGNDCSLSDTDNCDLYSFDAVTFSSPRLMSIRSSSDSFTSLDFSSFFDNVSMTSDFGLYASVYHEEVRIPTGQETIVIPAWSEQRIYPDSGGASNRTFSSTGITWIGPNVRVPSVLNGGEVEEIGTTVFPYNSNTWTNALTFDVDVSSLGSFNTFSLSGSLESRSFLSNRENFSWLAQATSYRLDIIVDGVLQKEFISSSGLFDFSDFIYSGSSDVSSIELVFSYNVSSVDYVSTLVAPGIIIYNSDSFSFDILTGNEALNGFNDQAQNDINGHNALESEWTGSMTANFDALSISDFEYPSGLISGFGLISGIFNDLWNGMGEYKIAYVFPLTLGVVLVVIGRIGRTKGGQGSGITNRGDSDA